MIMMIMIMSVILISYWKNEGWFSVLIIKEDCIVKGQKEKKMKKKFVGDTRTPTRDLELGSQVSYRYTKTFPIPITRKREMEFSNPTLQVKHKHDPGIRLKNKRHICNSWLSKLQHTRSSAKTNFKQRRYCSRKTGM